MKVGGHEVLSDRTEKSSKFTLTVSATIILIKIYNVPIADLTVLGIKAPPDLFDVVASFILVYALVSFIQHWVFDVYAWRKWFQDNYLEIYGTSQGRGEFLREHFSSLEKLLEADKSKAESLLDDKIRIIKEYSYDHNSRVKTIGVIGWLYILGQHFILPFVMAMAAFWCLFGRAYVLPFFSIYAHSVISRPMRVSSSNGVNEA